MKRPILLLLCCTFFGLHILQAQLPNGSTAPDFTATDINGQSHNLYSLLDQGKTVFLEFSATWCGPCWNYHNSGILKDMYNQYGPPGTNEIMVLFIEADPSTNVNCLYGPSGCNSSTQGNWVQGTPFPIIDDATGQLNNNFQINYFPTLYAVCPDKKIYEAGQATKQEWESWIQSCNLDQFHTKGDVQCVGDGSGFIDLTPVAGAQPLSFSWSNGATTEDISNIIGGTYQCTVTDGNGRSVTTGPIQVNGPTEPVGASLINQTNPLCFGQATGSLSVLGTGGIPDYQYQWSNGQSGPTLSNIPAGFYTLTVTDQNNCDFSNTYEVTQPPQLDLLLIPASENCSNGDGFIVAQGSGGVSGYMYQIQGDPPSPAPLFENLSAGTYTITLTDANQCSTQSNTTVGNIPPPSAVAGKDTSLDCNLSTLTLDGTGSSTGGSISYAWTTDDGNILSGANTLFPVVDTSGSYVIKVTSSANGCASFDTVMVSGNLNQPQIQIASPDTVTCTQSSVTIDASGSSSGPDILAVWTTSDGNILSGDSTLTPEVDQAGTYALTLTNTSNNCISTSTLEVAENTTPPEVDLGADIQLDCQQSQVERIAQISTCNTYSLTLNSPNNCVTQSGDTLLISTDCSGTISLTVSCEANGCSSSDDLQVSVDTIAPTADAGPSSTLTCQNLSVALDGSSSSSGSNISYQWTSSGGNITGNDTLSQTTADAPGWYTLQVSNTQNACFSTDSVEIIQDVTLPTASVGSVNTLDCTPNPLVLDGTGSSTGPSMEYLWTTSSGQIVSGETTLQPEVDQAGTYVLKVTDSSNGCIHTDTLEVNDPPAIQLNLQSSNAVSCAGANDGSATISLGGGQGNLNIQWSNGDTTASIQNLAGGNYSVTTTDQASCTATLNVSITEPNPLTPNATSTPQTANGANDGTASVAPGGGTPNYIVLWETGDTTSTIDSLAPGDYGVTITDQNGCTASELVTVGNAACAYTVSLASEDPTCFGSNTGQATVTPIGSAGPFSYAWSNGSQDSTATNLGEGTYTVSVTDANNCESTSSVTLNAPDSIAIAIVSQVNADCHGASSGEATVDASGGVGLFTYDWSNGESGATQLDLPAGTYTVTSTDQNNCIETLEVSITEPPVPTLDLSATAETSFGANDGTATAIAGGGTPGYSYSWDNGDTTALLENLSPGIYCVTIADQNGCNWEDCVEVKAFNCALNAKLEVDNVLCHGENNGLAILQISAGKSPFQFNWSSGSTDSVATQLGAGEYTVTVTDADNCEVLFDFEVEEPNPLASTGITENILCNGATSGSIQLAIQGGTGDYEYNWSNGDTLAELTQLSAGDYSVTVTDENQCVITDSFALTEPEALELTVLEFQDASCHNSEDGQVEVSPDGGVGNYTIEWSNGESGAELQDLAPGLYTASVTDGNQCIQTVDVNIGAPEVITLDLLGQQHVVCNSDNDGWAVVEANGGSGGFQYQWSNGSQSDTAFNLTAGDYLVTVTDANGCSEILETTIEATDAVAPIPGVQPATIILNAAGQANLTVPQVNNGSSDNCGITNFMLSKTTFDCADLGENIVILTVEDANGNTATAESVVTVTDVIAPTIDCPADIESFDCSGIINYDLPSVDDNCSAGTPELLQGFASGETFPLGTTEVVYQTTDPAGNAQSCSFLVNITNTLEATAQLEQVACFQSEDGVASVNINGGNGNYSILWDNGETGDTAFALSAGIHQATITDGLNCERITSVEITGNPEILIPEANITNETGMSGNGSIDITPAGGTAPYVFEWYQEGGALVGNTEDLTDVPSGEYTVVMTDANGCTYSEVFTIDRVVSTIDPALDRSLSVFPNPAQEAFTVQVIGHSALRNGTLQLFDLNGRLIWFQENFSGRLQINVRDFPAGVYQLRVIVDDKIAIRKVIKQ